MTNSDMLKSEIEIAGLKYKSIAKHLGISPYSLQKKIQNITEFKASEISKLCDLLTLSLKEKEQIFFATSVDFKSTS